MMAIPTNKSGLQLSIKTNYDKLLGELKTVSYEQTTLMELEGHNKGTLMSINNLLAYWIGWGELVLKWNRKIDNDEEVVFPETGYKWNELGKLAQKFYEDYSMDGFNTLLQKFNNTVSAILDLIAKKSNYEFYESSWYKRWSLGRMIQLNTSYSNAKTRIRKWKKRKVGVQQLYSFTYGIFFVFNHKFMKYFC